MKAGWWITQPFLALVGHTTGSCIMGATRSQT